MPLRWWQVVAVPPASDPVEGAAALRSRLARLLGELLAVGRPEQIVGCGSRDATVSVWHDGMRAADLPSWTALLPGVVPRSAYKCCIPGQSHHDPPLQPTPQAVKVKDVPARELLWRVVGSIPNVDRLGSIPCSRLFGDHLLATDDAASAAESSDLVLGRVRVPLVHVTCGRAVANEIAQLAREGTNGRVERVDVVDRQRAKVGKDRVEEETVGDQPERVCECCGGSATAVPDTIAPAHLKRARRKRSTCSSPPTAARPRHPWWLPDEGRTG